MAVSHSSLICHEEAEGDPCHEKQEKVEEDEACVAESACRKTGTQHRNGFQKLRRRNQGGDIIDVSKGSCFSRRRLEIGRTEKESN